jgi:hypothetical protein
MTESKKLPHLVADEQAPDKAENETISIAKPSAFNLDKFKSKHADVMANVETLQTELPHHNLAAAKDYVRLHPDKKAYWSHELCFVSVPVEGDRDQLHLIDEDLAMRHLEPAEIQRFSLALAAKPGDKFFLCHVPTRNFDNKWNESNAKACEQATTYWIKATSRRKEGIDGYKPRFSHDPDAFPEPKWPTQSLAELIAVTFGRRLIEDENHPGLKRLLGKKQSTS